MGLRSCVFDDERRRSLDVSLTLLNRNKSIDGYEQSRCFYALTRSPIHIRAVFNPSFIEDKASLAINGNIYLILKTEPPQCDCSTLPFIIKYQSLLLSGPSSESTLSPTKSNYRLNAKTNTYHQPILSANPTRHNVFPRPPYHSRHRHNHKPHLPP